MLVIKEVKTNNLNLSRKLELLRFKYMRENVKRMLKRIANPRRADAPIQNQFLSGKTSKSFSTATPNLLTLSEACKNQMYLVTSYIMFSGVTKKILNC